MYRHILGVDPRQPEALHLLGVLAYEIGQYQTAIDFMQQSIALKGNFSTFHCNLAEAYRAQGKSTEAAACYRRALALQPNHADVHDKLGDVLREQNNLEQAIVSYRQAIAAQPSHFKAHYSLGAALKDQGNSTAAIDCFRLAIKFKPDFAEAHNNLGFLLFEQGKATEAAICCRHAAQLKPEFAEAHNNLGTALLQLGELNGAFDSFQRATQLKPDFAEAHHNLGVVLIQLGALAEAEAALRASLQLKPDFAPALSKLTVVCRGELPDADFAAIENRLADVSLENHCRSELLFALAESLDLRGDYLRAADHLQKANSLRLQIARTPYDPAAHDRFVTHIAQVFDAAFFERVAGAGLETRLPVFIVGLPRAGTTLIEQILASHPQVHGAGELKLAQQSLQALPALLGQTAAPLDCVPKLDRPALARLAEQHLERLQVVGRTQSADGGAPLRIVDKLPENYLYLGLLSVLFPQATFIHCRRDLRDVAVSCWMTDFRELIWANDFTHIANRFHQYCQVMDHWRRVLPATLHDVDYEDVVVNLEGVARRLIAACGLDWDPACLEFHRTQRPIRTASVSQVRQPLYQKSVGRWRNYASTLSELFAQLPANPAP
jgi:tetratricopeptide (TPR) repeat protein